MMMLLSIPIFSFEGVNGLFNVIVLLAGFIVTITIGFMYFLWTRSRQMLNAIPGIWTSLGILGTFCVIVQTLGGGVNVLTNNAENVNGMVDGLVSQIIPAFTTSIIGIIGAIVTSLIIKIIYAYEDEEQQASNNYTLYKESKTLDIHFSDISPELLMLKIYKRMDENVQQLQALYDRIYETNQQQAKILLEEYLQSVKNMLENAQERFDKQTQTMLKSHSETIRQHLEKELQVLDNLSDEWNDAIHSLPEELRNITDNIALATQKILVERNNELLNNNSVFTSQLLTQVSDLKSKLTEEAASDMKENLQNLKEQLKQIVETINNALSNSSNALENSTTTLSKNMNTVTSSLVDSSKEYAVMVASLKKLLTSLDTQLKSSEKIDKSTIEMNKKIGDLLKNIDEIVLKNQQLRFELMQWKRVHKQVKINEQTGMKECPNCHTENPMDAYFCKHCNFGFWDTQAIRSTKQ